MKWTKTENIEIDVDNLPSEVYFQLLDCTANKVSVGMMGGGTLFLYAVNIGDIIIKENILDVIKQETDDCGKIELEAYLTTINKAREFLLEALNKVQK